jgi:hypothetical protein
MTKEPLSKAINRRVTNASLLSENKICFEEANTKLL